MNDKRPKSPKTPQPEDAPEHLDETEKELIRLGYPLNRKNYLALGFWEDRELSPEEEANLPERYQKRRYRSRD